MGICSSCFEDDDFVKDGSVKEVLLRHTFRIQTSIIIASYYAQIALESEKYKEEAVELVKTLDANSPVFMGTVVHEKYIKESKFEQKFVWVDISNHTIHMSAFLHNKTKHHKEASLAHIVSVKAGPPKKVDPQSDVVTANRCITICFKRGGGVDFVFATEEERNLWYETLGKIIIYSQTQL